MLPEIEESQFHPQISQQAGGSLQHQKVLLQVSHPRLSATINLNVIIENISFRHCYLCPYNIA